MRKSLTITLVALGSLAFSVTSAQALPALNTDQQVIVKFSPATGNVLKGNSYVTLDSYLSTRQPASTRKGTNQSNPVAKVEMNFPAGSKTTPKPKRTDKVCTEHVNQKPKNLKKNSGAGACGKYKIGVGWALISSIGTDPLVQLASAPAPCPSNDSAQYTRTYETTLGNDPNTPAGKPSCTPRGLEWVEVAAYKGGAFKVGSKWKQNDNAIIFANDNNAAPLSFGGYVTGNRLVVDLPALAGAGANPGELPAYVVLTDFRLLITAKNFLKGGPCVGGNAQVSTDITYSKFTNGDLYDAPAKKLAITSNNACTA